MNKALLILGILWASPITLLCFLFYIGPFWIFKWIKYEEWSELAWVWTLSPKAPEWLQKKWKTRRGESCGAFIIMKKHPESSEELTKSLIHEKEHIKQMMRFGIFQPILYVLCTLLLSVMANVDSYRDNPFEIAARNAAGQIKK